MDFFVKKINTIEKHIEEKNVSQSIFLALRCWQACRFSSEFNQDARVLLQKANHTAVAAHRRNTAHVKLYSLTVFIAIEAGHFDNANEMLDKAMSYKSFLRANEPFYYAVFCFLYAYLEIHQKRARSARKHWRALVDHVKDNKDPHYSIMQGLLHLASHDYSEAYQHLIEAFRQGSDSIFLYEGLYRYYRITHHAPEGPTILPVLIYAAARGADISLIAAKYQDSLCSAVSQDPAAGERLYTLSGYPHILKEVCISRILKGDLSPAAYAFYREAENKQVSVRGLHPTLIQAAYVNGIEHINHYPMAQYLAAGEVAGPDEGFQIYVYHLLLTSEKLKDLIPEYQSKILKLAAHSLESGTEGREINSLYYFFWQKCKESGITGGAADKAEEILSRNLTLFKLKPQKDSAVRFIYITEPEKRGMSVYEMKEESIVIEAGSDTVAYTCLGAGQKTVLDEKLTVTRMVTGAAPELYLHFFKKGDRRFHILTYLANFYLSQESPPETAVQVFEAMLAEKAITNPYRMRILVALGRLYYNAFSFDRALECYRAVDENALDNDFIEQILSVYLKTRESGRAMSLLEKRYTYISGDTLFSAVMELLSKPADHTPLTEAAYRLLLDGYYHKSLLGLVLDRYEASYDEWKALANAVSQPEAQGELDKKILETALSMARWDSDSQRAFVRLCAAVKTEKPPALLASFVEHAVYEMMSNYARPEYDALDTLEKWAINYEPDNILLA